MTKHISVQVSVSLRDLLFQETVDLDIEDDWDIGGVVADQIDDLGENVTARVREAFDNDSVAG